MNIIQNTIHTATKKNRLNILILPFKGDFETQLADLGHNLYLIGKDEEFRGYYSNKIKPANIIFFPVLNDQLKISTITSYDLIICTGRIHYELAKKLQGVYQIPIILVEHDIPNLQKWQIKHINNEIINNKPAAITSYNQVIFKHWHEIGLLLTNKNEWQNLFYKITKGAFKGNKDDESINNP